MNLENITYFANSNQASVVDNMEYEAFLAQKHPQQDWKGFDPKYPNFTYYILKITRDIWENHGYFVINETYAEDVLIHWGVYDTAGIAGVIKGTKDMLTWFPDRNLQGEEVIWSGNGNEEYLSSHRIWSTATNCEDSPWGSATMKRAKFRTIADCMAKDNKIFEEWLVRDNLSFVLQNGLDPHKVAKEMAKTDKKRLVKPAKRFYPIKNEGANQDGAKLINDLFYTIYNHKDFSKLNEFYHDNAKIYYICDNTWKTHDEIKKGLKNWFDSFENMQFSLERITINNGKEENSYKVAVRWWFTGKAAGKGFHQTDTANKNVEVLGVSHYYIENKKIVKEYIVYDGIEILRQIYK